MISAEKIKCLIEHMRELSKSNKAHIEGAGSERMKGYFEGKMNAYEIAAEAIQSMTGVEDENATEDI
jgi:hypothetical protein